MMGWHDKPEKEKVSVEEWNSADFYVRTIGMLELKYLEAATNQDVKSMLLHLNNLYSWLKRMNRSSRSRNDSLFDEGSATCLRKRLRKAEDLYLISLRGSKGSAVLAERRNKCRREAIEMLQEVFEDMGDFQFTNNLTFKEGIDVYRSYAEH